MGVTQVIYAFAAVAVAAILSFQFLVGSAASRNQVYKNEILTQVSGVAIDMIEDIGTRAFDERTREDLHDDAPASADELTAPANFGGVSAAACDTACLDIDDFHGLSFTRENNGQIFDVEVEVRYVDPSNPDSVTTTKQFAKEVVLSISNQHIYRKNNPDSLVVIEVGRVFTYNRVGS